MEYIILGAILILVGIGWIIFGIVHKKHKEARLQQGNRDYVPSFDTLSYFQGGSSNGEIYRLSLDASYQLKLMYCENNHSKMLEQTYEVEESTFRSLEQIIEEYHLREWKRLPFIDNSAEEESTTSVRIRYKDKSVIDIGTMQQLPPKGIIAMERIREILERNLPGVGT